MNPPPIPTPPPLPLNPDTLAVMQRATIDALPHHPRATAEEIAERQRAAFDAIGVLSPRDPLEALLAARIVALEFHLMEDLHCAGQPDLPDALKLRFQGRALALARLMDRTRLELRGRQIAPALRAATSLPAVASLAAAASRPAASSLPAASVPAASVPAASVPELRVPASEPAPRAQPAAEAAPASTQPPPAEGRHERRRRERAERHAAAAAARMLARRPTVTAAPPAASVPAGADQDLHQRLVDEMIDQAAASITALAA